MSELRFDDRVAVVTGAGGGLGREYALLLAARGAKVVVNDVGTSDYLMGKGASSAMAEAVAAEIRDAGGEAIASGESVSATAGGRAIVDAALDAWGRLDVVVHSAGIVGDVGVRFDEITDENIERVYGVHLLGFYNVVRPAWKVMIDQGYGRILGICSGSMLGQGEVAVYPAAKAAILGITRGLGVTGPKYGIKMNAVMPVASTRMTAEMPEPALSWLRDNFPPSKVAPVAAFLVHEDVPVSGECFSVGGGRFARVYLGETRGAVFDEPTLEAVRDRFVEAMDVEGALVSPSTPDELRLYAEVLGVPFTRL